jgi:hypothetical protein
MEEKAPDVMVIGGEWPERALLRAQLIEEGYDLVTVAVWPMPRRYRQPGRLPRVAIIDLRGLPKPRETLLEVRLVLPPSRVVVLTALGSLTVDEVRALGCHAIERPTSIGTIVAAIRPLLQNEDERRCD